MKPDLSKIVVGSRVTFVADEQVMRELARTGFFSFNEKHIISVEPPVFDWSSVKPGMRFLLKNHAGGHFCYWYIGPKRQHDGLVCVEDKDGFTSTVLKADLTPAPEDEG